MKERPRGLRRRSGLPTQAVSIRTEEAYLMWVKQFIIFHGKRAPREVGEAEIREFSTHLAADRTVAAST